MMSKDKQTKNDPVETSGNTGLDSLNDAAKEVLGPSDRTEDNRGGYVEANPDPRAVAAAHGDRLFTDADGNTVITEDPASPNHPDSPTR